MNQDKSSSLGNSTGHQLLESSAKITIRTCPGAAVLTYERVDRQ